MAGSTKLYPPTISGTLPAFYDNEGTATIAVPFSMNRAVNSQEIKCFSLKIKTVQSNSFICDLFSTEDVKTMIANKIVTFSWPNINIDNIKKVTIGQFLKVQMAYVNQDNVPGYYSTVGIIKYTAKPNIFIEGFGENPNRIDGFKSTYTGVYELNEKDKSERPYSYKFSLYDQYMNLVETSDWLLHNTTINNIASESLSLDRTTDTYSFNENVESDMTYYLQYSVRTINNLEVHSSLYACLEPDVGPSDLNAKLLAENIFEDGYINIKFIPLEEIEDINISIEICRAEKTNNFKSWKTLSKIYFSDFNVLKKWSFQDFTIEQGITYRYCFRQYNRNNIYSNRVYSNDITADFEDMFLWDGQKQLKIRFNPKVSSFKINRFEQKTDTIGSKFPFIFRNGKVEYKEFPISGLISYYSDNNELFISAKDDLNIILGKYSERLSSPVDQNFYDIIDVNNEENSKSWETSETLNSVCYNMRAERKFKLKVLDWLGDGKIKLFKSPAEGNYFVRLLNISLSPEDKLGRMLHSFSCTAYEIADFNYNNLLNLGFLIPHNTIDTNKGIRTINLKNWILSNITNNNLSTPIKINEDHIIKQIIIDKAPNANDNENHNFYLRFGASEQNKTLILSYNGGFTINNNEQGYLPDIYLCADDNSIFFENNSITKNQLIELVGDTQITYRYENEEILYGEFQSIEDVYLTNKIETISGPINKSFINIPQTYLSIDNKNIVESYEVLKIFTLNFKKKQIRNIIKEDNIYKDENNQVITKFDDLSLYHITVLSEENQEEDYYYCAKNNHLIEPPSNNCSTSVSIITQDDTEINFTEIPPAIEFPTEIYKNILIGNGVYLECTYQIKITQIKQNV